jgi:glycosyltransferase involved in cell wall biosynthesis
VTIGFDAKRLFNNFTGLGNYSRFVVKALAESYRDEQYYLYSPKIKPHPETAFFSAAENITIRMPEGLNKTFSGFWRSYSLGHFAWRDGVQIFHGLSNELPASKPHKLRTVVTIHDVIFKRYPTFYKPVDRLIYDWKFKNACESADAIVAVSRQTADDVVKYLNADKKKISVIYQGCHPSFKVKWDKQKLQSIRQKFNLPNFYILSVGSIEPRKNVLLLLKALRILIEKVHVVIVGKPTAYKKELVAFIEESRLQPYVTFIHNASFEDLPAIYQLGSVFVYPSLFEGFGIPIVEAISSGLPVITSTGSCFAEAGGEGAWYINPASEEELAAALVEVLHSPNLVQNRVKKMEAHIQQFEPSVIGEQLHALYQSLL